MAKQLFLCRHAHTREALNLQKDFDRQLSPAGIAEASAVGAFISAFGFKPNTIICSAARRTRQTAEIIAEINDFNPDNILGTDALYEAPTSKLLSFITELSADQEVVIMVGHNPAVSEVASRLINNHRRQVPTGGCCYFSFNETTWPAIEWAEIKYKLNF